MDTLSRDSNNSGSILPIAGVIAGVLAVILATTALFKLSTLQKTVTAHEDAINNKLPALEASVNTIAAKANSDLVSLRSGVQDTFTKVGDQMGLINGRIEKLEEAAKARAAAPAGKGGKPGVVTGVVDAEGNYVVAANDNLTKIAKKFATKVDAIEAENPGLTPTNLKVGQKIKIPKK